VSTPNLKISQIQENKINMYIDKEMYIEQYELQQKGMHTNTNAVTEKIQKLQNYKTKGNQSITIQMYEIEVQQQNNKKINNTENCNVIAIREEDKAIQQLIRSGNGKKLQTNNEKNQKDDEPLKPTIKIKRNNYSTNVIETEVYDALLTEPRILFNPKKATTSTERI
jgi:hypothetical protein